jgi:hypothetical protein
MVETQRTLPKGWNVAKKIKVKKWLPERYSARCSAARSLPCNDLLPFNFQTWYWPSNMKIGLNATWLQAHFSSSAWSQTVLEVAAHAKLFRHWLIGNLYDG